MGSEGALRECLIQEADIQQLSSKKVINERCVLTFTWSMRQLKSCEKLGSFSNTLLGKNRLCSSPNVFFMRNLEFPSVAVARRFAKKELAQTTCLHRSLAHPLLTFSGEKTVVASKKAGALEFQDLNALYPGKVQSFKGIR